MKNKENVPILTAQEARGLTLEAKDLYGSVNNDILYSARIGLNRISYDVQRQATAVVDNLVDDLERRGFTVVRSNGYGYDSSLIISW